MTAHYILQPNRNPIFDQHLTLPKAINFDFPGGSYHLDLSRPYDRCCLTNPNPPTTTPKLVPNHSDATLAIDLMVVSIAFVKSPALYVTPIRS